MNPKETFAELLHCVAMYGNRPALIDASDGRTLSFSDLHSAAFDLLGRLPADIPQGSRVVLYDLNPLDWVPIFFAIALRSWIVVPLDTRVSPDFIRSVETLTTPALIITGDNTNLTTNYRSLKVSEIKRARTHAGHLPQSDPNAPAEILFTSGTWAQPKGVVLSQKNILANAQQVLEVYHHKPEDISLAVLPLSHAYQQTVGLILPLLMGSQIVFLTRLSSEALTTALRKYRIKTMLVVPRVLSLIESAILRKIGSHTTRRHIATFVRLSRFLPRSLRRVLLAPIRTKIGKDLDTLVVGGAPLSLELDHFFQGLGYRVIVGYGASECSPVIAISMDERRIAGEIGNPVPGTTMRINENGEVIAEGNNVFLGYWPTVDCPNSFNTEDVATQSKNGSFVLRGRTKNLIVYPSGDKIFCEDIEHIANQIPDIEDSCVVDVSSSSGITIRCAVRGSPVLRGCEVKIADVINSQLPFGIRLERVIVLDREQFSYTHTLKPNRKVIQQLCATIE